MKKLWIVLGAALMVLALGTGVYAAADEGAGFKEMLPFMKQMHPDVSDQQLEEMYNQCHGNGNGMSGMMNSKMGDMMKSRMGNMMSTPPAAVQ